jgi:hypothetical protein
VRACTGHLSWLDVVQALRLAGASGLADTADLKVCTTLAQHRHGQEVRSAEDAF